MSEYTSYIIRKMLKPKKLSILVAEGYLYSMFVRDVGLLMEQTTYNHDLTDTIRTTKRIVVTPHTFERWNERVGPNISFSFLQKTLEIIFRYFSYRIRKIEQGVGAIDNDIIFTYENTDSEFTITTFYGRCSLQPSLNQLYKLRKYNLKTHEYINLSLSPEELQTQHLPLIPKEVVIFEGRTTSYILEKYLLANRDYPCFLCYRKEFKKGWYSTFVIDLNVISNSVIPNNVLYMLYRLGYGDYVLNYFKLHNPEKLAKVREKAREHFYYIKANGMYYTS